MSKDPNPNPPPKGGKPEILEDQVYRSSLAEGNSSLHRANPLVTVPLTFATWGIFGGLAFFLATQTSAGKAVVKKTIGIDLQEQEEAPPPPPPPPPPPAPAARPAAPRVETKEAPPPPPLTNQDIVPEIAPTKLPDRDLSMAYAGSGQAGGTGPAVAGGGAVGTGMAVVGASTTKVVDFDFSQIKIKYQPPAPPYPPLAKIAKIQGTVVVQVTIGLDGIPVKATAIDGPPQLRQYAENYAMQWKFEPAMLNGVPQMAKFTLTMPFRLK
jgi:protein TonB